MPVILTIEVEQEKKRLEIYFGFELSLKLHEKEFFLF